MSELTGINIHKAVKKRL